MIHASGAPSLSPTRASDQQEREYNPYYAYLAERLCESKYAYRVTFQYAFWDAFKELEDLAARARANLAHLLAHLVGHHAVFVSVFRVRQCRSRRHGDSP